MAVNSLFKYATYKSTYKCNGEATAARASAHVAAVLGVTPLHMIVVRPEHNALHSLASMTTSFLPYMAKYCPKQSFLAKGVGAQATYDLLGKYEPNNLSLSVSPYSTLRC